MYLNWVKKIWEQLKQNKECGFSTYFKNKNKGSFIFWYWSMVLKMLMSWKVTILIRLKIVYLIEKLQLFDIPGINKHIFKK